ncbi:MAG: aspartate/glutamate racemase family protein [Candidatus Heimdallarchaeaceae archaeon]|jgi:aspartate racemase
MKKIGIIGGLSAESTIEYYKIIIKEYNKLKGGIASPLLIIESLNLEEVRNLVDKDKWDEVFQIILQSAQNLEKAGAGVIIIATNTIHKIFDQVKESITTPMISIVDATAEAIKEQGLSKVGLLGTIYAIKAEFYQKVLYKHNLETIIPNQEDQEYVNQVIFDELVQHILNDESKKEYIRIIKRLQEQGAEGVILGCTEIPLLVKQEESTIPLFDTTTIHALATLRYALND